MSKTNCATCGGSGINGAEFVSPSRGKWKPRPCPDCALADLVEESERLGLYDLQKTPLTAKISAIPKPTARGKGWREWRILKQGMNLYLYCDGRQFYPEPRINWFIRLRRPDSEWSDITRNIARAILEEVER